VNRRQVIDVHIDELVLHGFDPRDRLAIGDAVHAELTRLFAEPGVTGPTRSWSAEHVNARAARVQHASPVHTGHEIARAVHGTLAR
jgi:hypothetical protein